MAFTAQEFRGNKINSSFYRDPQAYGYVEAFEGLGGSKQRRRNVILGSLAVLAGGYYGGKQLGLWGATAPAGVQVSNVPMGPSPRRAPISIPGKTVGGGSVKTAIVGGGILKNILGFFAPTTQPEVVQEGPSGERVVVQEAKAAINWINIASIAVPVILVGLLVMRRRGKRA